MATADDHDGTGDLAESRELVRSASKWFIAGLGGIGAVLVAGSQLSSVGARDPATPRFWVAIVGVGAGLLAIMWAMWRVVDVLSPQPWSFEDIVSAWGEDGSRTPHERAARREVGEYLRTHPTALGGFSSPSQILDLYKESEPDREGLDDLVALMDAMLDKAATVSLQARFQSLRWQIAAGVLLGATGIIAFAWAANPADPVQPKPSLVNAVLTNADLSGASLRNVDLTGADLTGADLTGADVAGAVLDEVTWGGTTCPDGTNSDANAPANASSTGAKGSCVGHLTP